MKNSTFYILNSAMKPPFYILPSTLIRPFYILHFTFYILLAFAMISCNSTTKPPTASLTGRVVLVNDTDNPALDPVDFAGVSVALYHLAVLDTTITRINSEYPQIGVQISQKTEFDHRLQNPVAAVSSTSDGTFTFKKIPYGIYNLVCFKQGWGFTYRYQINVGSNSKDDNLKSANDVFSLMNLADRNEDDIVLYPESVMPSVVHEAVIFKSGKVYRFTENSILLGNASFEAGSTILIDPGCNVNFHAQVATSGEEKYARITSSHQVYQIGLKSTITPFDKVVIISEAEIELRHLIIDHCDIGLDVSADVFIASDIIIRDASSSGLYIQSQNNQIEKMVVRDCPGYGIYASNTMSISKSVFIRNTKAVFLVESNATLSDSYIGRNVIGVQPFYGLNIINNNSFDANSYAIAPCAANPTIELNEFFNNNNDIEMNQYRTHTDTYDYSNPTIQRNSFHGLGFYFHLLGKNSVYTYTDGRPRVGVNSNQNYPYNYYKQSNLTNHIYDGNYTNSSVSFTVNYLPRSSLPIAGAGIRS